MSLITFLYNDIEVNIKYYQKEKMESLIEKFCKEISIDKKNLLFLNNGKIIEQDMTEDEITLNQDSKKLILVNDKNPKNFNLDKYIQSRIIPYSHY